VESGDCVVVLVACAVVDEGLGQGGFDAGCCGGWVGGEVDCELEEVEGGASIAIGEACEVMEEGEVGFY
jgi:hypothetical protein